MKRIALVTCVAQKRETACAAKDLYTGTLFEHFMQTARDSNPDEVFILSGKHQLLELGEVIEPYDVNLNLVSDEELKAWAEGVVCQLKNRSDLEKDHFVLIANPTYLKYLIPYLTHYTIPIEVL